MNIIAVIPARAGSKRLKNKNVKMLGVKPLVAWTIDVAKKVKEIKDIIVTTDIKSVLKMAKRKGIISISRPKKLASGNASLVDVCIHSIKFYEEKFKKIDGLLLLQPTSPFREAKTISKGINLFKRHRKTSIISVSNATKHPYWYYTIEKKKFKKFFKKPIFTVQTQKLPWAYTVNGYFYLVCPNELKKNRSFSDKKTIPFIISSMKETLDINDAFEFQIAKLLLKQNGKYKDFN